MMRYVQQAYGNSQGSNDYPHNALGQAMRSQMNSDRNLNHQTANQEQMMAQLSVAPEQNSRGRQYISVQTDSFPILKARSSRRRRGESCIQATIHQAKQEDKNGWPLITNHANKESIRQGKNPTTENSSDTSGGGQFLVQSHTRQHGSQCAWILICLTLQHTQLSDEIISFCQRMEIELSDFKDGKPLVFKGSGEQVQQIAQLKGAKKYKEMLDVSLGLPATKDSLMLRASALLHLREWNKLIECCNSGIALDENESEFYNLKGKAVGKLGNQEQKVTLLKIALQLNDSVAAYHRNLGAALYTLKEYPQAIREHSRAIQIEPNNSINYHNKGAALFRSGKYAQAKAEFTKAVERDPSLALSYSWIGDSEKQLGRPHEAVAMYTKAYEVSGNVLYLKQKQKLQKEISPKKEQQEEKKKKKMFGLF